MAKAKAKSFRYGRTVHLGPLTEQGRKNWDIAFKKEKSHDQNPNR